MKDKENAVGRLASLELGSEWVRKKVLLCVSFIFIPGNAENLFDVGGRCDNRVRARHNVRSEKFVRATRRMMNASAWAILPR